MMRGIKTTTNANMDLEQIPVRPSRLRITTSSGGSDTFSQRDGGFGVRYADGALELEFAPNGGYNVENAMYNEDNVAKVAWDA